MTATVLLGVLGAGCVAADPAETPSEPHALTAADVAVLMPLDAGPLWPATTAGVGGPLVPRGLVAELAADTLATRYDELRVVALRVDPCFMHNWGTAACQPQVRLTLQPVDAATGQAGDDALHALYNLDDAAFATLLDGLRAITAAAPEQADSTLPLGVSPALEAQGLDGPYGTLLHALITTSIGAGNLARLAATTRAADVWTFRGLGVRASPATGFGAPGPLVIRPLGDDVTTQRVTLADADAYAAEVAPAFANPAGHAAAGFAAIAALDDAGRVALATWMNQQGDPRVTTADNTDCAACHVQGPARAALRALDPDAGATLVGVDDPAAPITLRAFGYVGATPVVAPRAVAEVAATLATVGAR